MIITQQQSEQVVPVIVKTNYGPVRMTETPEKKFVLNLQILPAIESISRSLPSPIIVEPVSMKLKYFIISLFVFIFQQVVQPSVSISIETLVDSEPSPIDSQRTVVIQGRQQPIISPNWVQPVVTRSDPSALIRTVFSQVRVMFSIIRLNTSCLLNVQTLPAPSETVLRLPSILTQPSVNIDSVGFENYWLTLSVLVYSP